MKKIFALLCLVGLCGVANIPASAVNITGAGSSFSAPLYQIWSVEYPDHKNLTLNYQVMGSSAGQNQVIARTVDFGATDMPMSLSDREEDDITQIPTDIGGIVVVANVPGVHSSDLRLTGKILAEIYLGNVKYWDDPLIKTVNPSLYLPHELIAPLHRADGSGTTMVFTSYLSRSFIEWYENIGTNSSVAWPYGAGARGNDGIAAYVRNTRGSIGYLEYSYAARNHLSSVQLRNYSGQFVHANDESFKKATEDLKWSSAKGLFSINMSSEQGGWPIMTTTYALLPNHITQQNHGKLVRQFFIWCLRYGGKHARSLDYIPLPQAISEEVIRQIESDMNAPTSNM